MSTGSHQAVTGSHRAITGSHQPVTGSHRSVTRRVRIHVGDLISAGSAIGLLIVFFVMAWYGTAGVPDPSAARPALSGVETGWQALSLIRWVVIVTAVVAIGSVVLHATQRHHGARTDTSRVVLALGLLTTLLLIWRVLIAFPSPDEVISQKLGALLGLLFAAAVAYGGHESLIELRDRRRLARPHHRTATHATVPRPRTAPPTAAAPLAATVADRPAPDVAASAPPPQTTEADGAIALGPIDDDDFTWVEP